MYNKMTLKYIENCLYSGEMYRRVGSLYIARSIFKEALRDMLNVDKTPKSKDYRKTLKNIRECLILVNNSILIENMNHSIPDEECKFKHSDLEMLSEQKDNIFVKVYNTEIKEIDNEINEINEIKRTEGKKLKQKLELMLPLYTKHVM